MITVSLKRPRGVAPVELELHFEGLVDDVLEAVALVQMKDLAMAGEPPGATSPVEVGPFAVSSADPLIRIAVDVPDAPSAHDPGLVVRVRARTADGTPQQFLNTTASRLRPGPAGTVRVPLQRIT